MSEYAQTFSSAVYVPVNPELGHNPLWDHAADCAFPCATQNEINPQDADHLVAGGVQLVCEGANMPTMPGAVDILHDNNVLFAPGKAANAGGVAVSGLEMTQNAMKINWTNEEVDAKLLQIMSSIHVACEKYGTQPDGYIDYVKGANIAGFLKVANSMVDQGIV